MATRDLLLSELDAEAARTRAALARVPVDKAEFVPHKKSMSLGKLAAHIAQLASFGHIVLSTPGLDFETAKFERLKFESPEQLLRAFDQETAKTRAALAQTSEEAWTEPWKLSAGDTVFLNANRYAAFRGMYLNHIVHHRGQLGVYLRLLDIPVPSTYGPSADEA